MIVIKIKKHYYILTIVKVKKRDLNFTSIIIDIILTIVLLVFMAIATYKMVQSTNKSVEK